MPGTTLNEFKREIERRIPDPNTRWALLTLFEICAFHSNEMDQFAGLLLNLTQQQERFVELNKGTMEQIEAIKRRGLPKGVDIGTESVFDKPE